MVTCLNVLFYPINSANIFLIHNEIRAGNPLIWEAKTRKMLRHFSLFSPRKWWFKKLCRTPWLSNTNHWSCGTEVRTGLFPQQTSSLMVAFILMMTSFYPTVSVQGSGHTILNVISYHLCRHGSQKKNNTSDPNVTEVWRFEVAVVMLYTCCPDQCNVTHHSYRYIKLSPLCCEMQNVCGTLLR